MGEGRGATGRDGSCGEMNVQISEGVVDAMSAAEAVSTVDEHEDAIIRVALPFGVTLAESGIGVEKQRAAAVIGASGVVTASVGDELDGVALEI